MEDFMQELENNFKKRCIFCKLSKFSNFPIKVERSHNIDPKYLVGNERLEVSGICHSRNSLPQSPPLPEVS